MPFSRTSRTISAASASPCFALMVITFSSTRRVPAAWAGRAEPGGKSQNSCRASSAVVVANSQARRLNDAHATPAAAGSTSHGVKDSACTTGLGHASGTARKTESAATGAAASTAATSHARAWRRGRGNRAVRPKVGPAMPRV